MNLNITKISDIQYGYYEKTSKEGGVKYLNVGHFDEFGELTNFSQSFVERNEKNQRFILRENDVLFAAKGSRNFAWAYKEVYGVCIPSSAFYVIRLNPAEVLGEYLVYYLNTERMQYLVKQMVTGTGMPSIPKKEFLQLEITVPSLEVQQKIIDIAGILDDDIQLTNELLSAKMKLKRGVLNELIMNKTEK